MTLRKSICVFFALFALALSPAAAQFGPFHVVVGGTKVESGWGPLPADHTDPKNVAKYQARLDYLKANGFGGDAKIRLVTMDPIPGFPTPPTFAYVVFTWAENNTQESVHDYALFLQSPDVTLTELENHFGFGDPKVWVPFVEPKPQEPSKPAPGPTQPANPIGPEISEGSGTFFPAPGDTLPKGTVYLAPNGERYEKFVRQTPFGSQAWWKRLR